MPPTTSALSIQEAATELGRSIWDVLDLIRAGAVVAYVDAGSLTTYMKETA